MVQCNCPSPVLLQDIYWHRDYNCSTLQNEKAPFTVRCKTHQTPASGVQEQVQAKVQLKVTCLSTTGNTENLFAIVPGYEIGERVFKKGGGSRESYDLCRKITVLS